MPLPHGQSYSAAGHSRVTDQVSEVGSRGVRLVPAILQGGGAAKPEHADAQHDEGQPQPNRDSDDGRQVFLQGVLLLLTWGEERHVH